MFAMRHDERLTIRLDGSTVEELQRAAADEDRSLSSMARVLVRDGLRERREQEMSADG
jgi:uncharacterized protein (DUF1778 family)